jgi:hypothetical protein
VYRAAHAQLRAKKRQVIKLNPIAVAAGPSGAILVLDPVAGGSGVLFSIDPATGFRTFSSGFGNAAQGPVGVAPEGLAIVRHVGTCNGQSPTAGCTVNGVANQMCLGTPGDDIIIGTSGTDVIVGLAGKRHNQWRRRQ